MVQINFGQREVSCKVVFYGPGMSGKTTNLEIIHKKAPKDAVGEMVSIATETDRTLYFDFLPLDLGQVAGMRTKFQLYTVPGQIYYNATRKLVLQGVDGVIFVADSNPDKMNENLESLQNLRDNLAEMNLTIDDVPLVLQYNKRDLPNAMSMADMNARMNPMGAPAFEGVAREGKGVFATLKEISRLVIERLNKEHAPAANRRRTNTALGAPPAAPPSPATPARPAPTQPPPAMPPAPQNNTPLNSPRQQPQPPRAAPPPAQMPPAPVRSMGAPPAHTPARGNAQVPPAPVQAASQTADPREKHLAKAKPPAIEQLRNQPAGQKVNLGATDPSLKRYQETQKSGGGVKTLLIVLIFLVIFIIAAVVAVLYVPAVRALLPKDIQQVLIGAPPAATPTPAPVPAATPAPAPAATPAPTPASAPAPTPAATPTPAVPPTSTTAPTQPAATTPAPAPAPAPAPTATSVPALSTPPAPTQAAPATPAPATPPAPLPAEQTPVQPAPAPATPAPAPAGSTNGQ